ncbi:hypothetical protein [Vibrio phage BONAISHI]|nr:hypothetical protein [Vibrio phage BONAISHI]
MLTALKTFISGNSSRIWFIIIFALIATIFVQGTINSSLMKKKAEAEVKAGKYEAQITDLKLRIDKERRASRDAEIARENIQRQYNRLIEDLERLPNESNGDISDGAVLIVLCKAGLIQRGQCPNEPDS